MTLPLKKLGLTFLGACALILIIYAATLIPSGPRAVGPLESIHGRPFPVIDGGTIVEEDMAHADIYLNQPVFAKALKVTLTFIPHDTTSLELGIRENSFWLSYPKENIYTESPITNHQSPITSTVTIPLTNKLQEPDQSIDLMLFITADKPNLEVLTFTTEVVSAWPTYTEFKDYARAIINRERAL